MNNLVKRNENAASQFQCVNCRRVIKFTDNDEYICKYATTSIYGKIKPKCKYFKRNPKYITVKAVCKIFTIYNQNKERIVKQYKRGRLVDLKCVYGRI